MDVLEELIQQLGLEQLEVNLFRGQSQDLGWGTVFGGQVLGQALSAAVQTVPEDRFVHSLHGYFLRPGDVNHPIIYEVDRIRDGKSFATRRVVAIQKGRPIFNMAASFQVEEEGFSHQDEMPEVPGPEGLKSEQELAELVKDLIPEPMRERALAERPIELRPVRPTNPLKPRVSEPEHAVWYRSLRELPDDPSLHRYLLAYGSDFHFLTTALKPHGMSWLSPGMQMASLDHAMWFHRPFRMDEWLLHVVESPTTSGARGLVRGRFFTRDGKLVATTAQEGLMRKHG
ncbi:MAG: acyl-CoA thioesterase II [Myxococcota bacterium]|jgi:acyl-CoA thioesterase-2|nr:acyl-CoA thioesterase II [Myxococcota bacterium]